MKAKGHKAVEPIILTWHPGACGALWDADLNCHTGKELLGWARKGIAFKVIDRETNKDITRVFLAHWQDGQVVDPIGSKNADPT